MSYTDTCTVRVVKVSLLEHLIGSSTIWKQFAKPQKILYRKNSQVRAITVPDADSCGDVVAWNGNYGIRGEGSVKSHIYGEEPSKTDNDLKSVETNCGPGSAENFLVCCIVLGIHSNAGAEAEFTDSHAWLTMTTYREIIPCTLSMGLWGNKPRSPDMPDTDVHFGEEAESGKHNRYYLLSPSQAAALARFVNAKCEWSYFYTCANWAEDGYRIATGETISSRDFVIFGTPRAVGASIDAKESLFPTQVSVPFDSGEDAPATSSGSEESETGSSFPE